MNELCESVIDIYTHLNIIEHYRPFNCNEFYALYEDELLEKIRHRAMNLTELLGRVIRLLDTNMPAPTRFSDYYYDCEEYEEFDLRDLDMVDDFESWLYMECEEFPVGFFWFDKALELLRHCEALHGRDRFSHDFYWQCDKDAKKCIGAFERLTKNQIAIVYIAAFQVVSGYVTIDNEFRAAIGLIGEMERMVSFLRCNGNIVMPDAVWVL